MPRSVNKQTSKGLLFVQDDADKFVGICKEINEKTKAKVSICCPIDSHMLLHVYRLISCFVNAVLFWYFIYDED